jgi:hypothetical protein
MASEKVTVTITSSIGEDAPLTVNDAMRQILDFFELLQAAGGDEASLISWQLVDISMKSPLHATARAVAKTPGIVPEPIARREKARLAESLQSLAKRSAVPDWMDANARQKVSHIFERNLNGIGRTDIQFNDNEPVQIIVSNVARTALETLRRHEAIEQLQAQQLDLSRKEYGSIEGDVLETTTHYGHPAIRVRERLTGEELVCILSDELAAKSGPQHSWSEVWGNKRVLVTGQITYKKDGKIGQVNAIEIETIEAPRLTYRDIADPNLTGGLSAVDFLNSLWDEGVGQ